MAGMVTWSLLRELASFRAENGCATSLYLNLRMSAAWIQINDTFPPSAFASVLVPALVLIPLGCLPSMRHVLRPDAVTGLRARVLE